MVSFVLTMCAWNALQPQRRMTVHQNQMERDIYNHCQDKLRQWARDSQQLHELGDIPVANSSRNIMWLLMSLASWIAANCKIPEDTMIQVLVKMMEGHKEKLDVSGTHENGDKDRSDFDA